MRITFVLPMFLTTPAGGFKVVYEYANRLQARGHKVTLIHPRNLSPQAGWREMIKGYLWPYKLRWQNRPLVGWFMLSPQVKVQLITDLQEKNIPDADVIVATAFQTAFAVNEFSGKKGVKYYFIQHFEDWLGEKAQVLATWRLPMHKIVISKWLLDIAKELNEGENTSYIPNGISFSEFNLCQPIENRDNMKVAMMTHSLAFKGTKDGLEALRLLHKRLPQVKAVLFGIGARPTNAPSWCQYVQLPTPNELRDIYNDAAAFLFPSISEGWGLPAMEAMACGCAVVAAENQGIRDFAQSGVNALLAPIRRPDLLADNLYQVLSDKNLRIKLATAAIQSVREFSWERAVDSLEALFSKRSMTPDEGAR